ncbi:hypothetical protein ACJIZ3_017918 [Penstemon smallii]|uniref:Uncharacterized protein n=1 Tax=Penstemon smallii TaxID=265156 RepID=A0ABD3SWV6_9LAMI
MAGTSSPVAPHVIGTTIIELSRTRSRTGAPLCVRISASSYGTAASAHGGNHHRLEGPSCIFVGPVETASQETLEALYRQAREAYYSGEPLIVDDMFDRVEYPRCSLRRQSTYADAQSIIVAHGSVRYTRGYGWRNHRLGLRCGVGGGGGEPAEVLGRRIMGAALGKEDPSQVFALASVWLLILGFGSLACSVPVIYTIIQAYQDAFDSGIWYTNQASRLEFLATLNGMLFMLVGSMIGYPIASASVGALKGLWKNDLVALKGVCPNCGEEVFAFVRSDRPNHSPHRVECHVCESSLEFRTKVEKSISRPGRRWVHGRIYLIRSTGRRQRWT